MHVKESVTDRQGIEISRMARDKGLNRDLFQGAHTDGTWSRILDGIKAGLPITVGIPIIPPTGGRIHTVKVRKLRLDREWQEAVSAAGPNTGSDWNVRKAGDLYLPTGTGLIEEEEHILLNYPNGGGGWDKVLAWAAQFKLTPNDPRRVFGMAEQHPHLHRDLGMSPMYVVAPVVCTFDGRQQACSTWWFDAERGAFLSWTDGFGHALDWFSFRK